MPQRHGAQQSLHAANAVRTLDDILRRMHAHPEKKRTLLRALRLAGQLPAATHRP